MSIFYALHMLSKTLIFWWKVNGKGTQIVLPRTRKVEILLARTK